VLDDFDKLIINHIQSDFPITKRPYIAIAEKIGLSEDEVIERILRLKKEGIIRRIGGNFVPGKLGFVSTLCAARVPENKIKSFVEKVNSFAGVTHNYKRANKYNIWFTFIASDFEKIRDNLEEIKKETGVIEILNLPASQVFKIKAEFSV